MSSPSLKSLLSGVIVLLAAPAALADSSTSIPAFDARIAAARGANSPGGTHVIRSELAGALGSFTSSDDGQVDAAERAHLGTKVNDATFLTGITGTAKKLLTDAYELNDAATVAAPLDLSWLQSPPEALYGASGALASASEIVEGHIPNGQGVANQLTLVQSAYATFQVDNPGTFEPITVRELVDTLNTRYDGSPATVDEVDGAVAFITQISRNSHRLYVSHWQCNGCGGGPGDLGGYIVAAVSTDRRFVRMVKVRTWAE